MIPLNDIVYLDHGEDEDSLSPIPAVHISLFYIAEPSTISRDRGALNQNEEQRATYYVGIKPRLLVLPRPHGEPLHYVSMSSSATADCCYHQGGIATSKHSLLASFNVELCLTFVQVP